MPLADKKAALGVLDGAGKILLDCPLSGTGAQAAVKDLVVFGSGDEAAFERSRPVFEGMSRVQRYLGAFGNGSIMKYIANLLVTIHNVSAAEAMVLGMKAGLDPAVIYDTLADSAGSSRMFQVRGPLMRDNHYDNATATIRTHLKDLSVISALRDRTQLSDTALFRRIAALLRWRCAGARDAGHGIGLRGHGRDGRSKTVASASPIVRRVLIRTILICSRLTVGSGG